MTPAERREAAKAALREQILDASRRLFAEHGFAQVTMRRIAQEIGYSATTIYLHFPDKVALMRELCTRDFQALQQGFLGALAVADPVERIRAIGIAYVRFAGTHPHHYRLMFMTGLQDAEAEEMVRESTIAQGDPSQDAYALLVDLVRAAQAAGRLRKAKGDPHRTAQVLWAGLHGVIALHLDKGNDPWVPWRPLGEQAGTMIDVLLRGCMTEGTA
jgi:AcrR family transcriptional regulator